MTGTLASGPRRCIGTEDEEVDSSFDPNESIQCVGNQILDDFVRNGSLILTGKTGQH